MAEWWSIEVLHGEFSAFRWQEQHDSALIEAALTNGAVDGSWHADHWGVVFEICFENEEQWETFRSLPAVRAALDGAPDPVSGLLVYRGRGGGAGARKPRKPKPAPSASAVSLPEPQAARIWISLAFRCWIRCAQSYQPSSLSRLSSMPKWWATSWITVRRTCSATSCSLRQIAQIACR